MRVVILGNGLAGTMAGKTIRELDSQAEIIIFSQQRHHYYPRPNLIDFLAGLIPEEKVFAFPEGWAERQKLQVNLGKNTSKIDPVRQTVEVEGKVMVDFDYLVLATGALPFVPQISGVEKKKVLALRTLDDALELVEFIHSRPEVLILGGGLLGLEVARALCLRGLEKVTVVEFFNRLLPRQLDETGAALLQTQLEKMGIRFLVGKEAVEILGDDSVSGVRFKDGDIIPAGVVIVASGIKPRTELASARGLKCSRGVVVDDYLRTSHPRIYAAGDVAEHRGRVYGLIPAVFDQARALAFNLCGQIKKYEGTIPANTLKVAGIYLTSVGMVMPEDGDCEILTKKEPEARIYKKLVFKNAVCVGAIWFGTKKGVQEISRIIQSQKNIGRFKKEILEEDFDFSRLTEQ
jgi:nitrite reductase (NADH) large subunit